MSHGSRHRHVSDGHLQLLHRFLSDPHVEKELNRPRHIDMDHDIPDTSGYSMDGGTLYVDRHLAKAKPIIDNMPFDHWVTALVGPRGHEPIEWVGMTVWGFTYPGAHEDLAIPSERLVIKSLGGSPPVYEKQLGKWVKRLELERIEKPPEDLDCRAYYEDPDATDLKILKRLAELGVADALHPKQFHPVKLGAKKAPDGQYYVQDHARGPDKYLRVLNGRSVNSSAG